MMKFVPVLGALFPYGWSHRAGSSGLSCPGPAMPLMDDDPAAEALWGPSRGDPMRSRGTKGKRLQGD